MKKPGDALAMTAAERSALFQTALHVAAVDGLDDRELRSLFENIDLAELDVSGRSVALDAFVAATDLDAHLDVLSKASDEVRFGAMLAVIQVALSDDVVVQGERGLIDRIAKRLDINPAQVDAMTRFARTLGEAQQPDGDDPSAAAEAVKAAAAALAGVGVPIGAVAVSGTVFGLGAAGVTSGLAALGLGFGMVPGIGTVVALGTATFLGVRWLLKKRKQAPEPARTDGIRRERAIRNAELALVHGRDRARRATLRALDDAAQASVAAAWSKRVAAFEQLRHALDEEARTVG